MIGDHVQSELHRPAQKTSALHNGGLLLRRVVHSHGVLRATLLITLLSIVMSVAVGAVLTPLLIGPNNSGSIVLTVLVPAIIAPPIIYVSMHILHELILTEGKLRHISSIDELTGIFNRRHFINAIKTALAHAIRHKEELSLILMDLDHFKQVNDTMGHQAGDCVLNEVVDRTIACIRTSDIFARYGGEEFVILLPNTGKECACVLAERVLLKIGASAVETGHGIIPVTVSLGVTSLSPDDDCIERMLQRADKALYQAKELGRNRVTVH